MLTKSRTRDVLGVCSAGAEPEGGRAGLRTLGAGLGSILSSWEHLAASHGKKMTAGEAERLLISSTELWVRTVDFNVRGILQ